MKSSHSSFVPTRVALFAVTITYTYLLTSSHPGSLSAIPFYRRKYPEPLAQGIFELNLFPYKYPNILYPVNLHTYLPMKMEQTGCSEKSAYKIQTSENYPEESIQQKIYCSPKAPDQLYGSLKLLCNGYLGLFRQGKGVRARNWLQTPTLTYIIMVCTETITMFGVNQKSLMKRHGDRAEIQHETFRIRIKTIGVEAPTLGLFVIINSSFQITNLTLYCNICPCSFFVIWNYCGF